MATLGADDKELTAGLRKAETDTKRSAGVMQANLDKVGFASVSASGGVNTLTTSTGKLQTSSVGATTALQGLGIAAGATGSQALGLATQFAVVASSADELALSLTGAGKTGAALLKVLGPIAIVVTGIGVALTVMKRKSDAAWDSMERAKKVREEAIAPLILELKKLEDQQGVRLGFLSQDRAGRREIGRISADQEEFKIRARILQLKTLEAELAKKAQTDDERRLKHLAAVATHRQRLLQQIQRERRQEEAIASAKQQQLDADRAARGLEAQQALSRKQGLTAAVQQLLIRTGTAASTFISDPIGKRIAKLGEILNQRPPESTTGTFGLLSVQSPLGGVRGGEVIGRQQLTTSEQHKDISARHLLVAEQLRDLFKDIIRGTNIRNLTPEQVLRISGGA
ncbi:MAG: hypothetical protein O7D91_17810 [Planctomycetota bacterium]|nr:hypothetical protein [Planctomycetota bacterium]